MRFMVMMIPDVYKRPVPPDFVPPADAVEKMDKFNEELQRAGVLLDLDGLHPPEEGSRIAFDSTGKPIITNGRCAETTEAVGGYWILQVKSRAEAIKWVKRCPAQPGDVLELRKVFEPEDFGAAVSQQEREVLENISSSE
jgi:hypothetical protein